MNVTNICLESDGIKLAGEVYVPAVHEPCPALCICHGVPANAYNPADRGYAALAQRFCHAGFVTLIFNFRGAGRSEGNLDMLGWTRDLQAALDFLYDLEEIDRKRISLLGFSGGAAVSVYVTARDPRISLLLACACPAHFRFLTGEEAAIATIRHFQEIEVIRDKDFPPSLEEWLRGFDEVSPMKWIDKVSPRPLLLVHGDADEVVPLEHAYRLYQKAKQPKELAIIAGAKHKLRLEEEAVTTVLDWLKARC
jgi:alpha/beta superfamily hydrolase